ncbi:MAG: hypothetical protein FJ109_11210 [Deltaproteobacteria bacterium]|nr:hypothetical protein [Deltaproteobacteria bacterium]
MMSRGEAWKRWTGWVVVAGILGASSCSGGGGGDKDVPPDTRVQVELTADVLPEDVPAPDAHSDLVGEAGDLPLLPDLAPQDLPDLLADLAKPDVAAELVPDDLEPSDVGPLPPVAEPAEPAKIDIPLWLVALVPKPENDPIGPALDAGTFVPPTGPGKDSYGIQWYETVPGPNGQMGYAGYSLFYAVARFDLPLPTRLLVRADRFYQVYVNGSPQPGDPYMTRAHRTPGRGLAGENVVVASAYMAVKDPEVELFTLDSEVYFNLSDVTAPDLVAGSLDEQWLGIATVNLSNHRLRDVSARVIGSGHFEETEVVYPSLPASAVTQVGFKLVPASAPGAGGEKWPVTVRLESYSLDWSYEKTLELSTAAAGAPYKRTRRSNVDHSVQYYGVNPPSGPADPFGGDDPGYALVLSLHGAGVQGIGQAQAYGQKEWTYVVAPTNRRPFGFDWEEWGRLDGIETLEDTMSAFGVNPDHVYVTGHSMGGHGTWQFGVHFSDRFRVIGPSAGWSSFYSYGGSNKPTGPFARARASSDTLQYVGNLANRAVYVIHGDKDDNVPISEAYLMAEAVEPIADEFYFHIQPGAGHWWDGDAAPGADCVDWPPLFEWMHDRMHDKPELDFEYKTPSPWVNGTYSFVSVRSQIDPYEDSIVESESSDEGKTVAVSTSNVRGMVLDGKALKEKGVAKLVVDGKDVALASGPIEWGLQDGKSPSVQGPLNQVFHRPFCFVYPNGGSGIYRDYVQYLVSTWNIIGNGHACALSVGKVTPAIRKQYNLVYVGVPRKEVPVPDSIPFDWSDKAVSIGGKDFPDATLLFVFPEEGHLSAALVADKDAARLLYWEQPFSSRSGLPDYTSWSQDGVVAAGYFDGDWTFDPALGVGL